MPVTSQLALFAISMANDPQPQPISRTFWFGLILSFLIIC